MLNAEQSLDVSGKAWVALLEHYGIAADMENLRANRLPGLETVMASDPSSWVQRYEQIREALDKKERKQGSVQSGVFYTPAPVAGYLAHRILEPMFEQARQQIAIAYQKNHYAAAQSMLHPITTLTIVDPACGTGVFLAAAVRVLNAFYQDLEVRHRGILPQPADTLAQSQVWGMDLDPVSVLITRARLQLPEAMADRIRCGNTLKTAWDEEPMFDLILGNPPYVSEVRGQSALFRTLKAETDPAYYQAKMDLSDAFMLWGIRHLKSGGKLAYVLPEYWTQRTQTAAIRNRLWAEGKIRECWTFPGKIFFRNAAGHESSLFIWERGNASPDEAALPRSLMLGHGRSRSDLDPANLKDSRIWLDNRSRKFLYGPAAEIDLLARLSQLEPLLKPSNIQQGVIMPQGRMKPADADRLGLPGDTGVFLLNEAEIQVLQLNDDERLLLKPFYPPTVFSPFQGFSDRKCDWLIYTDMLNRKKLEKCPERYPNVRAHLDRFAENNPSAFSPYGLHRARQPVWFEDAGKIFCLRQGMRPAFALVSHVAYVNESFYSIRIPEENPYYVVALLNSSMSWFWLYRQKRKGFRLQVDKEVLCHFPKPPAVDVGVRDALIQVSMHLSKGGPDAVEADWQMELDALVYQAYGLSPDEIAVVQNFVNTLQA